METTEIIQIIQARKGLLTGAQLVFTKAASQPVVSPASAAVLA